MAVYVQKTNISPRSRRLYSHHGLWDLKHACLWAKSGHGAGSMEGLGSPEREGDEDTVKAAAEGITSQHVHARQAGKMCETAKRGIGSPPLIFPHWFHVVAMVGKVAQIVWDIKRVPLLFSKV